MKIWFERVNNLSRKYFMSRLLYVWSLVLDAKWLLSHGDKVWCGQVLLAEGCWDKGTKAEFARPTTGQRQTWEIIILLCMCYMPKVYSLEWQHGPHCTLFASKGLWVPALRWPLERNPNNRILKKRAARLGVALSLSFRYFYIIIPAMSKERKKSDLNTLFCQLVLDLHPQQLYISVRKRQMESLHLLLSHWALWKKK